MVVCEGQRLPNNSIELWAQYLKEGLAKLRATELLADPVLVDCVQQKKCRCRSQRAVR